MTIRLQSAYRGGCEGRSGWWLAITYTPEAVETLKATINWTQRSYNDTRAEWWIDDSQLDGFERICPAFSAFRHQGQLL